MSESEEHSDGRRVACDLLRFLDELMRAIVHVELGSPGVAQLTLLEMRILSSLAEAREPVRLGELAGLTGVSVGQTGQATARLRTLRLVERVGGGRGKERAVAIALRGRRLLSSIAAGRQKALESFIAGLGKAERLRLEGATHLLGRDLDRLSEGMLVA
jgi:DNA-binding MarR family transcriptional regulator